GHPIDVQDNRRARQTEVEQRDQALTAGEDLRLVAVARQELEGLVERSWGMVRERRRLHAVRREPISASRRAGLTGVSVTRTPQGSSASSIALAMAAGGEIAPPSPSPFTPSGFREGGAKIGRAHV